MQIKKYFKNVIHLFIMASLVIMPYFSFTQNAEAQNTSYTANGAYGANAGASASSGSSANLQGYIKGLAPAIAQLPLCKKTLKNGTGDLFNKLKGSFNSSDKGTVEPKKGYSDADFVDKSDSAGAEADSVGVYDKNLNSAINIVKTNTEQIKSSTDSIDKNDTCLKSIGRMVTKLLLQKITVSTVNWINGGFEGKPTFIQDPQGFFTDIAKNEILQFGTEISNENLFPFGRAFMEAQAMSFQKHFADNAQYSLDKLIADTTPQYSSVTFNADFSQGGWAAWNALTQVPANNPLGFHLLASNELQVRLEGTAQSTAQYFKDDLDRAKGFMSQVRCADPEGMTKEMNDALIANGDSASACKKWIYVTPGSLIADAATNAINYPNNQLLKSEDLNDAVAAILDALLNQFSSQLFSETGLAGVSGQGADGSYYHNTIAQTSYTTTVDKDFPYANSTWLNENPDFNIRTDLTQALIDEQRIYKEKLEEQNAQLFTNVKTTKQAKDLGLNPNKMVDPQSGKNYGLIPIIHQLDYCIPGPHPGFEEDAQASLAKALSVGGTPVGLNGWDKALGFLTKLDSYSPLSSLAGPTTASGTIGTIINLVRGDDYDADQEKANNANIIQNFAGVELPGAEGLNGTTPVDFNGVTVLLQTIVDGYIKVVHNIYSPAIMPDATKEAAVEFKKIPGYLQMLENNIDTISSLNRIIIRLTQIKEEVNKLNQQLQNNSITQAQYEENLKPWISSFGRLTSEMVTGDDIAKADNLLKQIKDKEVYLYNDLLKGPNGCEQDVQVSNPKRPGMNLPTGMVAHKRYVYPLPIMYDYNSYPLGASLPDPLYNPLSSNPKSLFTISNTRHQSFDDWDGSYGLKEAGFGTNPANGGHQPSVVTFCNQIQAITGIAGNCNAYEGPTFIDIRMVNIHNHPNGLDTLERSLGIF